METREDCQLEILRKLLNRLGGQCSDHPSCCPEEIGEELYDTKYFWHCKDCVAMFKSIVDLEELSDKPGHMFSPCPCILSRDFPDELPGHVVIARLEERINELEEMI